MSNDYLLDKHILLVDDEQELLDMVHSILDEYGFHHINTAKSIEEWRLSDFVPYCTRRR